MFGYQGLDAGGNNSQFGGDDSVAEGIDNDEGIDNENPVGLFFNDKFSIIFLSSAKKRSRGFKNFNSVS